MGKRIEKAFTRDKGQGGSPGHEGDDPNKTPEPHNCTGHFHVDFTELCKRNGMSVIPPVIPRPRRPPSPSSAPPPDEKPKGGKKEDKKAKEAPPPEPEPEIELDENGEPKDPPPKTFTTRDKFDYFKPCVQVEMDNPERYETVTEVCVRGWLVDMPMMTIFKQCFVKMDRLHTINLWQCGLTDETVDLLASFLPECAHVKNLILDNNPIKAEGWYKFLRDESLIQQLSLRYCKITDTGAKMIGQFLGTPTKCNQKLVALNLSGNKITDVGAESLANGLRTNRTLLTLGLANNQIGDLGAKKFAETISQFKMTHEEIVERRKLLSEKSDGHKSPSSHGGGSKRSDSQNRDRPGSVKSFHANVGKSGKSAKKGKDGKEEKEKHEKGKGTKGKEDKGKGKDTKTKGSNPANGRTSAASTNETKATTKGKEKGKGKKGGLAVHEAEPENQEMLNPILDQYEKLGNGEILLIGNRTLISLNLAWNQIGEEGIRALYSAIGKQTTLMSFAEGRSNNCTGLMRISLNRNNIDKDHEILQKLNTLMVTKDPFYKPPPPSPDQDTASVKG